MTKSIPKSPAARGKKAPSKKKKPTPKKPASKAKHPGRLPKCPDELTSKTPKGATLTPRQMPLVAVLSTRKNGFTPAEFAEVAYADSPGWENDCRTGTGPNGKDVYLVKGGAMNITAGAALSRLVKDGAAYLVMEGRQKRYHLTQDGYDRYKQSLPVYKKAMKNR